MAMFPRSLTVERDPVLGVVARASGIVFYLILVVIVLMQLDIMDLPSP